jgi:hypothetical protein
MQELSDHQALFSDSGSQMEEMETILSTLERTF